MREDQSTQIVPKLSVRRNLARVRKAMEGSTDVYRFGIAVGSRCRPADDHRTGGEFGRQAWDAVMAAAKRPWATAGSGTDDADHFLPYCAIGELISKMTKAAEDTQPQDASAIDRQDSEWVAGGSDGRGGVRIADSGSAGRRRWRGCWNLRRRRSSRAVGDCIWKGPACGAAGGCGGHCVGHRYRDEVLTDRERAILEVLMWTR